MSHFVSINQYKTLYIFTSIKDQGNWVQTGSDMFVHQSTIILSGLQRKEGNHIRALTWSAGQDVDADTHINKHSAFSGAPRRKR